MSHPFDISSDTSRIWKSFILNVAIVVLVFILGLFLGLIVRNHNLIEAELQNRARAHFENIVLTRRWNAGYGGVFVEKKPGVESNPYLENPDITTVDGRVFTKKNPALMTREVSEIAEKSDAAYRFHITSLTPLNPHNLPDEFERKSLKKFEAGARETVTRVFEGDRTFYRYMGPLGTEESCLPCHGKQGYRVGDVRGGISVQFDISDIEKSEKQTLALFIFLGVAVFCFLFGSIFTFIVRVMKRLNSAQETIREMAVTDALTRLANRRSFFLAAEKEMGRARRYGLNLGCLMLDVDFFKKINDDYGHQAGDRILQEIAHVLKRLLRESDLVGRYGGEEFIALLPETGEDGAKQVAERIREAIAAERFQTDASQPIPVTLSVGVACFKGEESPETENLDQIIKRADNALYRAKQTGRNRVCFSEGTEPEETAP
ncbi:MAG TPA: diguanylate cyclase [Candidatus Sumerlaeota bacterium]|nr:diguanylate cyclase [Candidatus Sumerlaeota bacterium]HPS00468.1 diguanylate cyclase [Candidatus Sumerlaeota bacterium]